MKIEQYLQSKSKEEIAFILYAGNKRGYKISCLECPFLQMDKYNILRCCSFVENRCREEFHNWYKGDIVNRNGRELYD